MSRYILMRLVEAAISVLGMTVIIFVLVRLTGNPLDVYVPSDAGPQAYEEMAHRRWSSMEFSSVICSEGTSVGPFAGRGQPWTLSWNACPRRCG